MPPYGQDCNFVVYRHDGEMLVKMSGWLRLNNSEETKKQIQSMIGKSVEKLYLHIGSLHEIDSAGLGILVGMHMNMRKDKIEFALLAPSGQHMHLLETTRLTSILKILTGVEAETVRTHLEKQEYAVGLPWETEA